LQATQKKFRRLSIQPGLCGSNELRAGGKMVTFQLSFSFPGTRGSLKGPEPENRVEIKTSEAQVGQFLLGCKCLLILRIDPKTQGENFSSRFLHLEFFGAG